MEAQQVDPASYYQCEELLQILNVNCFALYENRQYRQVSEGTLRLLTLPILEGGTQRNLTFIEVEAFHFPLIEGLPCLRVSPIVFIFPLQVENQYIAFVFSPQIPTVYVDVFERQISHLCIIKRGYGLPELEPPRTPPPTPPSPQQPRSPQPTQYQPRPAPTSPSSNRSIVISTYTQKEEAIVPYQPQSYEPDGVETITISSFSTQQVQTVSDPVPLTPTQPVVPLAQSIERASVLVGGMIEKSGDIIVKKMYAQTENIKQSTAPLEKPLYVPSVVKTSFQVTSAVTPAVPRVSGYVIAGLMKMAGGIGTLVGKGISAAVSSDRESSDNMKAAIEVGKATFRGASTMWDSLENAGSSFAHATKDTTVQLVDHKYGHEAAGVVDNGLSVTGDALKTAWNVKQLMPTSVTLSMAASSAVATVKEVAGSNKEKTFELEPNPELDRIEGTRTPLALENTPSLPALPPPPQQQQQPQPVMWLDLGEGQKEIVALKSPGW